MFEQIQLPYPFDALEPTIDALTVETHYTKHHATYTKKFNDLAEKAGIADKPAEVILAHWKRKSAGKDDAVPIRNNGGGFYNHNLYFGHLSPDGGGEPGGALAQQIAKDFGSFADLKEQLNNAAVNQFGSGYSFLSSDKSGALRVDKCLNQDSPLLDTEGAWRPIFCLDVWEHAYYLKYKNLRPDYVKAFFNIVNWNQVAQNYEQAQQKDF